MGRKTQAARWPGGKIPASLGRTALTMQQEILINYTPQETRVAVVENGAVQELHVERALERGQVGDIYLGKVVRVLPGMQSAFIDIGAQRTAFLHVADVWQPPAAGEAPAAQRSAPQRPIEKLVFEGQALMVQVIKDAIGAKGARLSTQISIAGRMLVFLPQEAHVGISQKIAPAQRESLRQRVQALAQQAALESGGRARGGFIVRTNAEDADDAALAEDIAYLRKTWACIREAASRTPPGALLRQDLCLMQRVLRDMAGEHTQSIRIDSQEQLQRLLRFGNEFMPQAARLLSHYSGERPIFDLYGIDEEITRALGRRVELKSGGYLVIDQTEALTTIDVNTGAFTGARNFGETIDVLRDELLGGLSEIDTEDVKKCLIAYEPVWAISTSKQARPSTPDEIAASIQLIKEQLIDIYGKETVEEILKDLYYGAAKKIQEEASRWAGVVRND